MNRPLTVLTLAVASIFSDSPKARAYDIDCAILLCLAGGFPSSPVCAAAHREMIRRVTPWPVLPPVGVCSMPASGGAQSRAIEVSERDFPWIDKIRILWFSADWGGGAEMDHGWSWSVASCSRTNENCIRIGAGQHLGWGDLPRVTTEGGQTVEVPVGRSSRALLVEYATHDNQPGRSDWIGY